MTNTGKGKETTTRHYGDGWNQRATVLRAGKEMEDLEPSITAGRDAKDGTLETVRQLLGTLSMYLPYNLGFPHQGIYPRKMKTYVPTKTSVPKFIVILVIITKN